MGWALALSQKALTLEEGSLDCTLHYQTRQHLSTKSESDSPRSERVWLLACLLPLIHDTSCNQSILVFKMAKEFNMILKYCPLALGRLKTSGGISSLFALGAWAPPSSSLVRLCCRAGRRGPGKGSGVAPHRARPVRLVRERGQCRHDPRPRPHAHPALGKGVPGAGEGREGGRVIERENRRLSAQSELAFRAGSSGSSSARGHGAAAPARRGALPARGKERRPARSALRSSLGPQRRAGGNSRAARRTAAPVAGHPADPLRFPRCRPGAAQEAAGGRLGPQESSASARRGEGGEEGAGGAPGAAGPPLQLLALLVPAAAASAETAGRAGGAAPAHPAAAAGPPGGAGGRQPLLREPRRGAGRGGGALLAEPASGGHPGAAAPQPGAAAGAARTVSRRQSRPGPARRPARSAEGFAAQRPAPLRRRGVRGGGGGGRGGRGAGAEMHRVAARRGERGRARPPWAAGDAAAPGHPLSPAGTGERRGGGRRSGRTGGSWGRHPRCRVPCCVVGALAARAGGGRGRAAETLAQSSSSGRRRRRRGEGQRSGAGLRPPVPGCWEGGHRLWASCLHPRGFFKDFWLLYKMCVMVLYICT